MPIACIWSLLSLLDMRIDIDFLFAQLIIRVLRELEVHIYVKVLCIYADVSPTGSELMNDTSHTTRMIVASILFIGEAARVQGFMVFRIAVSFGALRSDDRACRVMVHGGDPFIHSLEYLSSSWHLLPVRHNERRVGERESEHGTLFNRG